MTLEPSQITNLNQDLKSLEQKKITHYTLHICIAF